VNFRLKNRRLVIILIVLFGMLMLAFGQARKSVPRRAATPSPSATTKPNPRPEKARDVVCGIMVEKDPRLAAQYKGQTYYFCSKADRDRFNQNPQKYEKDK
jgi:YHS domain-containing protein